MNLYRFYANYGRMGHVEGLLIATPEQISAAKDKIAYFGEILGKHSNVVIELKEDMFTLLSEDKEKIEWLKEVLKDDLPGYNPLDYIRVECSDCGELTPLDEMFTETMCKWCHETEIGMQF